MGNFNPTTITKLVGVLNDICRVAQNKNGHPLSTELKNMFAKRILASFEAGITDPEILKADALRAVPFQTEERELQKPFRARF